MADSIGSFQFLSLTGTVDKLGKLSEDRTRPNVDGHALGELGRHSKPTQLESVAECASESAGETLMAGYKALQASMATVTLCNVSRGSVYVWEVEEVDRYNVVTPVGGSGLTHIVVARWTVQKLT